MRFSVIIPLYNKAPYVAKAIQSVLAQTYTNYELIIMDDGSNDESYEIALNAIKGYNHCHIYKQQNAGVSVARNTGAALSCGDYLCFLDADDWWDKRFLDEMSQLIDEYSEAGIFGTNYTIVNEMKRRTRVAKVGVEDGFERGYINYCKVYANTMYMPLTSITVSIPRQVFESLGGFTKGIKLGEDFLLWIRIALKYKVAFLNKPLAYYNQDVDVANRGVGRLHKPQEHMLWNVGFLSEEEKTNADYKQLIDKLRVKGLLPYYLLEKYHEAAAQELKKVEWGLQPFKTRQLYRMPIFLLKTRNCLLKIGSKAKQMLKR